MRPAPPVTALEVTVAEVSLSTLDKGDIHERADVGRQLSRIGVPDQIPRLLDAACEDKSPGVRLYAIGAAADILSRYRVGASREGLPDDLRQEIHTQVRRIDPSVNAGMFSVLATLGLPRTVKPILVGLQDPRLDVRTGAAVGMFRYCISWAAHGDQEVRARGVALLSDPKVRPDVRAHLVRICAYCGWTEARPVMERFLLREDQVRDAAEQALAWLDAITTANTLGGLWWSDGADAGEIRSAPPPRTWLLLGEGVAISGEPGAFRAKGAWEAPAADALKLGTERWSLRRMILAPPGRGEERDQAFQHNGRTWYRATAVDILELAEGVADQGFGALPEAAVPALVDPILAGLPDKAESGRLAARIELIAGLAEQAVARLEEIASSKKPAVDIYFWLGEARAAAGDAAGAREAWSAYLKKAPKRAPYSDLAQERLGGEP
ncbi:MAG: hypothetical protein H6739_24070 [Alphaproteobacteria bacterium]|nr:hypothetical protein [Alphaproteobacteria bacterium]